MTDSLARRPGPAGTETAGIVREDGIFVADASVTELPHETLH